MAKKKAGKKTKKKAVKKKALKKRAIKKRAAKKKAAKKRGVKKAKGKKPGLAPGIKIEKLTKMDLNTEVAYKNFYPHWDRAKIAKKLKATLAGKDDRHVAKKNGKLVGQVKVVYGKSIHAHRAEITSLIVLPTERKQGIGTALMEHAIKKMPKGISLVLLAVDMKNSKAISIYKAMGFRKYGLLKKASKIKGRYADNLLMKKSI